MKKVEQRKCVKVTNIDYASEHQPIAGIITFEEDWFFEGETLQNCNKGDYDITLIKQINRYTFEYRGDAKKEDSYRILAPIA